MSLRYCRATKHWRNRRLIDRWNSEKRESKQERRDSRNHSPDPPPPGYTRINHGDFVFDYNFRRTIRILVKSPPGAANIPPWPGFYTNEDITLKTPAASPPRAAQQPTEWQPAEGINCSVG